MIKYYTLKKPLGATKLWEAKLLFLCKQLRINVEKRHAKKHGKIIEGYDISCDENDYKTLMKMLEDQNESTEN